MEIRKNNNNELILTWSLPNTREQKKTKSFLKCYFNTVCIEHIYGFALIDIGQRKGDKKKKHTHKIKWSEAKQLLKYVALAKEYDNSISKLETYTHTHIQRTR